jgi:hypothetical protein
MVTDYTQFTICICKPTLSTALINLLVQYHFFGGMFFAIFNGLRSFLCGYRGGLGTLIDFYRPLQAIAAAFDEMLISSRTSSW